MAKKFLAALATILLLGATGFGIYYLWNQYQIERQEAARMEEINARIYAETLPLAERRNALRTQVEELEKSVGAIRAGTGTVQYLVTDLSTKTTEQIISLMLEQNETAVLGLSVRQFPGQDGCMTAEQALGIAERGWSFCYCFSSAEARVLSEDRVKALSLWLDRVESAAADTGITMENAILFPSGSFAEEYVAVLKQKGIDVVIHHGEIGHTIYTADEEDGIWYVGAAWWWKNSIASVKFSQVAELGGSLAVEIGAQDFGTTNPKTAFDAFDKATESMSLLVTDFEGMKQQQRKNRIGDAEAEQKLREQIDDLNRQIDEVSREIQRIENRYLADVR